MTKNNTQREREEEDYNKLLHDSKQSAAKAVSIVHGRSTTHTFTHRGHRKAAASLSYMTSEG